MSGSVSGGVPVALALQNLPNVIDEFYVSAIQTAIKLEKCHNACTKAKLAGNVVSIVGAIGTGLSAAGVVVTGGAALPVGAAVTFGAGKLSSRLATKYRKENSAEILETLKPRARALAKAWDDLLDALNSYNERDIVTGRETVNINKLLEDLDTLLNSEICNDDAEDGNNTNTVQGFLITMFIEWIQYIYQKKNAVYEGGEAEENTFINVFEYIFEKLGIPYALKDALMSKAFQYLFCVVLIVMEISALIDTAGELRSGSPVAKQVREYAERIHEFGDVLKTRINNNHKPSEFAKVNEDMERVISHTKEQYKSPKDLEILEAKLQLKDIFKYFA